MTRSAARRGAVQAEQTPPAPPTPEARYDDGQTAPAPSSGLAWYWRLALFLWATSFAFLILYEWLAGLVKAWTKK